MNMIIMIVRERGKKRPVLTFLSPITLIIIHKTVTGAINNIYINRRLVAFAGFLFGNAANVYMYIFFCVCAYNVYRSNTKYTLNRDTYAHTYRY